MSFVNVSSKTGSTVINEVASKPLNIFRNIFSTDVFSPSCAAIANSKKAKIIPVTNNNPAKDSINHRNPVTIELLKTLVVKLLFVLIISVVHCAIPVDIICAKAALPEVKLS